MKNILVLSSTFPRWRGDTTPSFVYELSSRLAGKGRKIVVLAPHAYGSAKAEKLDGMEIRRFQYFIPAKLQKVAYGAGIIPNVRGSLLAKLQVPLFLMSEFFVAKSLARKHNPAIVHAHWMVPQGLIGVILKKIHKSPLIVTVHGSDLFPLKNFLFRKMQKIILKNCDICTVNSEATKNEITKRFPEFSNKLAIIPMGVDTKIFFKNSGIKNKFKQYKNRKIVLFAGRLNEQKGTGYLVKALPIIKSKFPNALLLIIGEGEYKRELENLVSSLKLHGHVEFLGAVEHEKIADYCNLADVFVLPSVASRIGTEGLGLVLLEAMACGTCVVATPSGGIRCIVKDNENGLLANERDEIDLANKVVKALSDKKLRDRLAENGRKYAKERYDWENIANKFDKIYRNYQNETAL